MKKLFTLVFILFAAANVFAQSANIMGSYMRYEVIDSTHYRIFAHIYKDCSSAKDISTNFYITGSGLNTVQSGVILSRRDITPIGLGCPQVSTCSNGSYSLGIEEVILTDTLDLSSTGACWIEVEWRDNYRIDSIYYPMNAHLSPYNHENFLVFNKCANNVKSSSQLKNIPRFYFIPHPSYFFAPYPGYKNPNNAYELDFEENGNDSSGIQLDATQVYGYGVYGGFGGGFNYNPRNPFGTPYFNGTDQIIVTSHLNKIEVNPPTISDRFVTYALNIEHWNDSNGTLVLTGKSRLDLPAMKYRQNNQIPVINSQNEYEFIVGVNKCYEITVSDSNSNDSLTVAWHDTVNGPVYGQTQVNNTNALQLCWQPDTADYRPELYTVKASVNDNACPLYLENFKEIKFKVRYNSNLQYRFDSLGCDRYKVVAWVPGDTTFQPFYSIRHIAKNQYIYPNSGIYHITEAAQYEIWVSISGSQKKYSNKIIRDSLWLQPYNPHVFLQDEFQLCENDTHRIFADSVTGIQPFTYHWYGNGRADSLTYFDLNSDTGTGTVKLMVLDANGCPSDTAYSQIKSISPPQVFIGNDTVVCQNAVLNLTASVSTANFAYTLNWSTGDTGLLASRQISKDTSITVWLEEEISACLVETTIAVETDKVSVSAGADKSICPGDSVSIPASITGNYPPYTYLWNGTSGNAQNSFTAKNDTVIVLSISDNLGCVAEDTFQLNLFDAAVLQTIADTSICEGEEITAFVLGGTAPYTFTLNASAVNNPFFPSSSGPVVLELQDANNCKDSTNFYLTVNPLPVITISDPNPVYCMYDSSQNLSGKAGPAGGKWTGAGVSQDSIFDPYVLGAGNFSLSYHYTDVNTCKADSSILATVRALPAVSFTANPLSGQKPLLVNFSNTSATGFYAAWHFGEAGATDTGSQVSHTYVITGAFDVTLLLNDSFCFNTLTKTAYIEVTDSTANSMEVMEKALVRIFPNPSNSILNLETKGLAIHEVKIYEISGKLALTHSGEISKSGKIDISSLQAGQYILELILADKSSLNYKLIVQ